MYIKNIFTISICFLLIVGSLHATPICYDKDGYTRQQNPDGSAGDRNTIRSGDHISWDTEHDREPGEYNPNPCKGASDPSNEQPGTTPSDTDSPISTPTDVPSDADSPTDVPFDADGSDSTTPPLVSVEKPQEESLPIESEVSLMPLEVTEYMVRSNGNNIRGLPQWIELYNPNSDPVDINGYTFKYANPRFTIASVVINRRRGMVIEGNGVVILTTHRVPYRRFSGISASSVYDLGIRNFLKNGWVIIDNHGREISKIGIRVFDASSDPEIPSGKIRVSHTVKPSEAPPETYFYGDANDVGTPGFYEPPIPSSPSLVRKRTLSLSWASLKRPEK